MKPPRARRPSGCPVPYDRGRFGAFLSSVARDTSPSPNSSPLPTPPHLLEVQQPAGGGRAPRCGPAGRPSLEYWPEKTGPWLFGCCRNALLLYGPNRRAAVAEPPTLLAPKTGRGQPLRPFFRSGAICARNALVLDGKGRGAIAAPGPPENCDSEAWAPRSAALRTASIVLEGVAHAVQGGRGGVGSGATARGRSHVRLPCSLLEDRLKARQHRHRKP